MSTKITKVSLIPFREEDKLEYLTAQVVEKIKPVVKLIDKYGEKYDHEAPWKTEYSEKPKFWLYRVTIGAVGRISNSSDAITLGLLEKTPAQPRHFTCTALYYIYRVARQVLREYLYLKDLEKWMNTFVNDKNVNSRFLEYYNLETEEEENEEEPEE